MARIDKGITPSVTAKLQELGYDVSLWDNSSTLFPDAVKSVFRSSSKKKSGNAGFPDRVYCNQKKRLLVIVEEKGDIRDHDGDNIEKQAVPGVKWYLSRFLNENLEANLSTMFDTWKIIGIAVSGDLSREFSNKFSAFYVDVIEQNVKPIPQLTNFVQENEFEEIFNNLDEEKAIAQISVSSKKINNLLRSIDSQKRPVLLSALMISLYIPKDSKGDPKTTNNDFANLYKQYEAETIVSLLPERVVEVLAADGVPEEKTKSIKSELAFIKTDPLLTSKDILKDILIELENSVIPLFNSKFSTTSNYDIIGKFYEEFLRYAGVSNVKKGIVLTPRHITTLFTELVPMKYTDKVVDLACGTGAFLIAAMNKIISLIKDSKSSEANERIRQVKEKQLLGFEINPTMYILSISNMLFRNDGKSAIYNKDSINDADVQSILKEFKPDIGFINPPYSGKENRDDPTPKEITFIEKMLANCSRYGVVIAPISTFFKDLERRKSILNSHTLKYVINMPSNLFAPNAATHTSIAVFETHKPHKFLDTVDEAQGSDMSPDIVVFYDLDDDGFVLTKNRGRTDVYGKWYNVEQELLNAVVHNSTQPDGVRYLRKPIKKDDEWTVQQHLEVDYSNLSLDNFLDTIADFIMFSARKNLGILNEKLSDFELYKIYDNYFSGELDTQLEMPNDINLDIAKWRLFELTGEGGLFEKYDNGERLVIADRIDGTIPFLTAGEYNQGFTQGIGNYEDEDLIPPSLTIDMFFNVFYQDYNFQCDDNVYFFNNDKLNAYNALFIATILKMQKNKYGYGRQFRKKNAEQTKVLLPVKNGEVDYDYMESFIKKMPYSELLEKEIKAGRGSGIGIIE